MFRQAPPESGWNVTAKLLKIFHLVGEEKLMYKRSPVHCVEVNPTTTVCGGLSKASKVHITQQALLRVGSL
jgi:hypothetical protein